LAQLDRREAAPGVQRFEVAHGGVDLGSGQGQRHPGGDAGLGEHAVDRGGQVALEAVVARLHDGAPQGMPVQRVPGVGVVLDDLRGEEFADALAHGPGVRLREEGVRSHLVAGDAAQVRRAAQPQFVAQLDGGRGLVQFGVVDEALDGAQVERVVVADGALAGHAQREQVAHELHHRVLDAARRGVEDE
jgi:hypothetical protein